MSTATVVKISAHGQETPSLEERRAWEWGIESAILSARKARERAG